MKDINQNNCCSQVLNRREFLVGAAGVTALVLAEYLVGCAPKSGASPEKAADTVVYSTIYRSANKAATSKAMAIKNGLVVFVGSKDEVASYIGETTEILDYTDQFILPGFIDGHAYISTESECACGDLFLAGCTSFDELVQAIRSFMSQNPNADFIRGYGWKDGQFAEGISVGAILDEACSNIPIYLLSEDCRSCWVNTAMMNKCGVTAETKDPIGGTIEHLESGKPSGCFRGTAIEQLINLFVPDYSVAEYKNMLRAVQERYAKLGYIAYNDIIPSLKRAGNVCQAYAQMETEGSLLLKINATVVVENNDEYVSAIQGIKALADQLNGSAFKVSSVEFIMDGPIELNEAYMLEPYEGTDSFGVDMWPGDAGVQRLNEATRLCNDLGLAVLFRADGDAAVRKALDAIDYAQKSSTNKDARNCIVHAGMVSADDMNRFAALDVAVMCTPGMIPLYCSELSDIGEDAAANGGDTTALNIDTAGVGEERQGLETAMYRYKSLRNAGASICYATDYPTEQSPRPFYNLQALVTQQYLNVESTVRNEKEVIAAEDALVAITTNGARQLAREAELGSLAEGKCADFIVVDQDILSCSTKDIYKTEIVTTYCDGRLVYGGIFA